MDCDDTRRPGGKAARMMRRIKGAPAGDGSSRGGGGTKEKLAAVWISLEGQPRMKSSIPTKSKRTR